MSTEKSPELANELRQALPPLALIAGPTASGKSDLAVRLAQALNAHARDAVIVNADSAQVYADLSVVSARPGEEEMAGIPHRLFGTWDGAVACSAADWAQAAKREIIAAHAASAVPILVGGTGLYMRTLLDGIAPVPPIDPQVRADVRALSVSQAYKALCVEDAGRAAVLAPGDTTRIARALEVVRSTGKPLAHWQQRKSGGIADAVTPHPMILLPPRDWLYERCDRRFAWMLDHGGPEEVERLLARGLDPDLPVMRAIGVPEMAALVRGERSRLETLERGAQATRNYAKRQYTWFRRQPPPEWPRAHGFDVNEAALFERLLRDLRLT